MKKTFTIFALFILNLTLLNATKIPVNSVSQFTAALSSYSSGDTLLIAEGTYDLSSSTRTISKTICIMGNPSALNKPKIKGQWIFGGNCSLYFEGVEPYYNIDKTENVSSYFIQAVTTANYNIPVISLKDCYIHGFGRSVLRADNGTIIPTISNLIIDNCIIEDIGRANESYSVLAVKTGKISNVTITNTTVYDCPNGFWYSEVIAFPITFNIERCSLIKVTSTTGAYNSKLLFNANTNPGSSYTLKNCLISDSNDGEVTNMQLKLGSNGTNHFGYVDNVVFGNNMNSPFFTSTTLTTDNETEVLLFSYNYALLTVTTYPNTVNSVGDPRWKVNGVWTELEDHSIDSKVYIRNGNVVLKDLPEYASVEVYNINGMRLYSENSVSGTMQFPATSRIMIIRVLANGIYRSYKIAF